jgi:hypothetical protein
MRGCAGILKGLVLSAVLWAVVAIIILALIWLPAIIK